MSNIEKLIEIMAALRNPDSGCPWDLEQHFETIVPHTLEEAYEVADSIETGNLEELCSELGDLLFQVVFYARLAEEQGLFSFEQVVEGISEKLVRRHPHVFGDEEIGDEEIASAEAQTRAWEAHKAQERAQKSRVSGDEGVLSGIANALPALTRSVKLQKRAAQVGFDWPTITPIFDKIHEEMDEVRHEIELHSSNENNHDRIEDEIGDLLFACTNLARHARVNPETALRRSNRKFERRFAGMEKLASNEGLVLHELDLDRWERLWEQAKSEERPCH